MPAFSKLYISGSRNSDWEYSSRTKVLGTNSNERYYGLATDGTTVVAVGSDTGNDALIRTSTDGSSWTERTTPNNVALFDVMYDATDDIWVAVGEDGRIYTATDPTGTWSNQTRPQNVDLYHVSKHNGVYHAIGALASSGAVYWITASDPTGTWTDRSFTSDGDLRTGGAVHFDGSDVALGGARYNGSNYRGRVVYNTVLANMESELNNSTFLVNLDGASIHDGVSILGYSQKFNKVLAVNVPTSNNGDIYVGSSFSADDWADKGNTGTNTLDVFPAHDNAIEGANGTMAFVCRGRFVWTSDMENFSTQGWGSGDSLYGIVDFNGTVYVAGYDSSSSEGAIWRINATGIF